MVSFSSQSDRSQSFDNGNNAFYSWESHGTQKPRIEVAKRRDIGITIGRDHDANYFQQDFGNITHAALNNRIQVSLNRVGDFVSKSYNTQYTIADFMNHKFDANIVHKDLSHIYHRLKEFAAKKGYKNKFEVTEFTSGFTRKNSIAGVEYLANNNIRFYRNQRFSKFLNELAKQDKISYEAEYINTMMHEFLHILGVRGEKEGNGIEAEAKIEALIEEFSKSMLNEIYNSQCHSEKRKWELARVLRQIGKISSKRKNKVYETYKDVYNNKSISDKIRSIGLSKSELEKIVSELTKEAVSMEMSEQGINEYVAKKLIEIVEETEGKENYNNKNSEEETEDNKENKKEKSKKEN